MEISITNKDIFWSYLSKFLSISSGFITLPLVLYFLSAEEVGMNYLMLSVSSIVALLDFGFSPQFSKNISYVYSGANELSKEGILTKECIGDKEINFYLFATVIETAKMVYRRLSVVALILMLTFGTAYVYHVTNGFTLVNNTFAIWVVFSLSTFFNIYYIYYSSLLTGCGMVMTNSKANMLSRITYIVLTLVLLFCNFGLFAVVISNFISPFIYRAYCYYFFYTKEMKAKLNIKINRDDIKKTFDIIWYNAKKMGLNFISSYAILKSSIFIMGFFLSLKSIASFGLMQQLTNILISVGSTFFLSYEPLVLRYRVENNIKKIQEVFSLSVVVFYVIVFLGLVAIVFIAPLALSLIQSNTELPGRWMCFVYIIIIALEYNHCIFAELIATKNSIPYVKAFMISGIVVLLLDVLLLKYTNLGLWSVVLSEGLIELSYNNWKWPKVAIEDLHLRYRDVLILGYKQLFKMKI